MVRRLALPIALAVTVGAIVVVSAQLGYLGRKDGGPLVEPTGFDVADDGARPGRFTVAVEPYAVEGERVRVTRARALLASPGMRLRAPRRNARVGSSPFRSRRWPPPGDLGPVVGRRLKGRGGLAFGVRVREPGIYVLWRYAFDYQQGARSYRRVTSARSPLCVARRSVCPGDLRLPAAAASPLADLGGPSDYGVRPRLDAGRRAVARLPARAGTRAVTVTLTNRAGGTVDVRGLRLPAVRFGAATLRQEAGPVDFSLAAGGHRTVTLRLRVTGCEPAEAAPPGTAVRALTATVDGRRRRVPLLAGVALTRVAAC